MRNPIISTAKAPSRFTAMVTWSSSRCSASMRRSSLRRSSSRKRKSSKNSRASKTRVRSATEPRMPDDDADDERNDPQETDLEWADAQPDEEDTQECPN